MGASVQRSCGDGGHPVRGLGWGAFRGHAGRVECPLMLLVDDLVRAVGGGEGDRNRGQAVAVETAAWPDTRPRHRQTFG